MFPGPADRFRDRPSFGDVDAVVPRPGPDLGGGGAGLNEGDRLRRELASDTVDCGWLGGGPVVGGSQVAVGPFLGQAAGLAEDDRDVGPAVLAFGQPIGDNPRAYPVLLVA